MPAPPRPYIGLMFRCCNVYTRIYLNKEGTLYAGSCPKCGKHVEIKVGPGGSKSRFWTAE
jgi:hypothetical protein